jgi:DNA-binding Lrp family transcriptional regulator
MRFARVFWRFSICPTQILELYPTVSSSNSQFHPTMHDLDKIDRALLAALQTDGRMSNAKLAEAVGLSETPCARRLKRLGNDGYIERYRAELSRRAFGSGRLCIRLRPLRGARQVAREPL